MLYLSDAALQYAVDRCLEKDGYKVGIVTTRRAETTEKLLQMTTDVLKTNKRYGGLAEIVFNNGSVIRCMPVSESCRGRALHQLIVDEDISEHLLTDVFRPMEKLEWIERRSKQEDRNGQVYSL